MQQISKGLAQMIGHDKIFLNAPVRHIYQGKSAVDAIGCPNAGVVVATDVCSDCFIICHHATHVSLLFSLSWSMVSKHV